MRLFMFENDVNIEKMMLKEISSHSVLSREDEKALFVEYETANDRRKNKIKTMLINANMRFVLHVALGYTKKMQIELTDLVSEGKLGLITAIDLFDHKTNNKFISFAVWHIKCKISKYLENRDLIRLPSHQKVKLNKAKKENDYEDVDSDIRYLWDVTQQPLSFDTPSSDGEFVLGDIISDVNNKNAEQIYTKDSLLNLLYSVMEDALTTEEIEVISSLYGLETNDGQTLRDAGDSLNKSYERIRQIREKALKKLRKNNKLKELSNTFYDLL